MNNTEKPKAVLVGFFGAGSLFGEIDERNRMRKHIIGERNET